MELPTEAVRIIRKIADLHDDCRRLEGMEVEPYESEQQQLQQVAAHCMVREMVRLTERRRRLLRRQLKTRN